MRSAILLALSAIVVLPLHAQEQPATVIRVVPERTLPLDGVITVIFDQPVLRSLPSDPADAARYLSIEPAVSGVAEWRDPVTLRFRPEEAFTAGRRYTVRIRDGAPADSTRARVAPFATELLGEPARMLTMEIADRQYLPRDPRFLLLYSVSPEHGAVERAFRIEFDDRCRTRRRRVRVIAERPLREDDPAHFRYTGVRTDLTKDLRRVIEIAPDSLLDPACAGVLIERRNIEGRADSVTHHIATRDSLRFSAASCLPWHLSCPRGGVLAGFSTPVRLEDVQRHLGIAPAVPFTVRQRYPYGEGSATEWWIDTRLRPLTQYTLTVAPGLTDIFGQSIVTPATRTVRTTALPDTVLVPGVDIYVALGVQPIVRTRAGRGDSIAVSLRHVAGDRLLSWLSARMAPPAGEPSTTFSVPVLPPMPRDSAAVTDIVLPFAQRPAARVTLARIDRHLVRVHQTGLGVHARIGSHGGAVLVTGLTDLRPRAGALVTVLDSLGRELARARTGRDGVARMEIDAARLDTTVILRRLAGFRGRVHVELGDDRTFITLPDATPLGHITVPWQPDYVYRYPGEPGSMLRDPHTLISGSVIADRGIYRPGEMLYVRGIVREGVLGALRLPTTTDSLRWSIRRRWRAFEPITRPITLTEFGTVADSFRLSLAMPLDEYEVTMERRIAGDWVVFGSTPIRVAEYRPPAFLVNVEAPERVAAGLDSLHGMVSARYLFDAPLAGARLRWTVNVSPIHGSALRIPRHERYRFGHWSPRPLPHGSVMVSDSAALDAEGRHRIGVSLDSVPVSTLARMWLAVGVTDADRQEISASAQTMIHPVDHYVGARTKLFVAGRPSTIEIVAATPEGERLRDVPVQVLVRRPRDQSWQRMWADSTPLDTIGRCALRTASAPVSCEVTPAERGMHEVILTSTDGRGRESETTLMVWAAAPTPWNAGNPHALDVTAARDDYVPGDTIDLAFSSPFPRAQAWITVERETVLSSEVREVHGGMVTHRLIIPPTWAPNAFISVMLVAPVPAEPRAVHSRPLVVSGRTEVKITPTAQRLNVAVEPRTRRADAGDTARIDVLVTGAGGRGVPSEVAVWAVDEGVLSLTGFETPDAIAGLYRRRDRMLRDASMLLLLGRETPMLDFVGEPQTWESMRLSELRVLGAAALYSTTAASGVMRILTDSSSSQSPRTAFRTTAFFIGAVRTDARGVGTVAAKLPDNLTTFRVMAVAVSAGDAYGSGSSSLVVTRPLLARPALPRFARPGDTFVAGAVVHREDHAPATVRLGLEATGIGVTGPRLRELVVRDGVAAEGRFGFRVPSRDSIGRDTVLVRLSVDDGSRSDVVDTRFAIRPDFQPRWHTRTGVVRDTATVELLLPPETDPTKSRLVIAAASSPAAIIRRASAWFDAYPYSCTEQLVSAGFAMTSLAKAERAAGEPVTLDLVRLQRLVDVIVSRQGDHGGFGYWTRNGWTSSWLTAYAGLFLIDAREVGAAVNKGVLEMAAGYLDMQFYRNVDDAPYGDWWNIDPRARMSDRVAALDYLERYGHIALEPYRARSTRRHVPGVMELAPRMAWEDRVRLAEVLWRMNEDDDRATATRLLREAWSIASVLGNRLSLPDTLAHGAWFFSRIRPAARLLTATLTITPDDPRVGPLAELLVAHGRADERWVWSTQDWGPAVVALAALDAGQRRARVEPVRILTNGRELARLEHGRDSSATSLAPFVVPGRAGDSLRLRFQVRGGGTPVFFHASVEEIPRERPLKPDHSGIVVERWYERTTDGAPLTEVAEGELVRVRLRVTVPSDRFFVIVDDPLPAGLEVVDLGLRTSAGIGMLDAYRRLPAGAAVPDTDPYSPWGQAWLYGNWWSPWDHREYRDDRMLLSARMLWRGTYSATYLARATTAGTFVRPPAHAEEMYNRGVRGRSEGGTFVVRERSR